MNYLVSLEKAIDYIEQHLNEEIVSEDIAKAAGYSLYHLTRIFTATIGEPIGSYIQKRRLSDACKMLLHSDKRVLDIAIESGFSSSESFSRAFKMIYGISPVKYRKNGLDLYTGSKKMLDRESLLHLDRQITIRPEIAQFEPIRIAGIHGQISTQHNILPELWGHMTQIAESIPLPPDARRIGICESDRDKVSITADGDIVFSEMVGMEIDGQQQLPETLDSKIIPGGRYAVFTHKGSISTLIKTYDYIWGSWILFTKEILDDREDFEIYDERFLGYQHPDSQIDICIPVK